MILTVWTRAILLGRRDIAEKFAREIIRTHPEMAESFQRYLSIKTPDARVVEETWILVKNPKLTAFVVSGIPERGENEVSSWSDDWWQEPSDTEYDDEYNEVPKKLPRPSFVTVVESEAARREVRQITARGGAEAQISARVFDWLKRFPRDPRLPEALYVVAVVNVSSKYGSGDEETRAKALDVLKTRYSHTPWLKKAQEEEY